MGHVKESFEPMVILENGKQSLSLISWLIEIYPLFTTLEECRKKLGCDEQFLRETLKSLWLNELIKVE